MTAAAAKVTAALAAVFVLALLIGADLEHCVLLAVTTGVVLLLLRLPAAAQDEWPERQGDPSDRGVRREVARLSWGLHGFQGRVDRRAAARLQSLAGRRLERLGVDLAEPADAKRARALLGDQAYAALTTDAAHPPRYDHFTRAVAAVEQLSERNRP